MGNHCPGSIGSYKKSSAACAVSFLALPAPVFYLQLASDGFGLVVCNSVALPACGQCEWVTIAIYFLAVPIGSMTMYFLKRNKSDVL